MSITTAALLKEALPAEHCDRFVAVADIRRGADTPAALRRENHNERLQQQLDAEVVRRMAPLRDDGLGKLPVDCTPARPDDPLVAVADRWYARQADEFLMPQRLAESGFRMLDWPRTLPLTPASAAGHTAAEPLFADPRDFLEAFEEGLSLWRGPAGSSTGSLLVLGVGGGAATRAKKYLPLYPDYMQRYGVTEETPRVLYPIMGTERTFKGMIMTALAGYARHLGIDLPHTEMITAPLASRFTRHLREHPEAPQWDDNTLLWTQQTLQRYALDDPGTRVPGLLAAGHADVMKLSLDFGLLAAARRLGITRWALSNGDEFLWYYLAPALMAKLERRRQGMFMFAVPNANNQFGGCFREDGLQVETPLLPFPLVQAKVAPSVLNTTFALGQLAPLEEGGRKLAAQAPDLSFDVKTMWVGGRYVNLAGYDNWMGTEATKYTLAGGGTVGVGVMARNLFLGFKGPQHAADTQPQSFLGGLSYSAFYTRMATRMPEVIATLTRGTPGEKRALADRLFTANFELLGV